MKIRCDECNKLMRTHGAKRVNNKLICYTCSLKYIPKIYMLKLPELFVINK